MSPAWSLGINLHSDYVVAVVMRTPCVGSCPRAVRDSYPLA
ncbi:unnamed protein product [Nippostrongylus brasiliensis]|uniref:Transposase n=1 Tax=Nippostrongylus brasiliensis TaxID=27835 RepID=A0A0N4YRQ9_NIPBR|nr:unnamed protein product [Nippostrongylus brasiliensis]